MAVIERHWQDLRWFLLIFALAFAIRVAFIAWVTPDPRMVHDDSWFYHHAAVLLADGRGYIFPGRGVPTAFWPPGYSAILSAVYLLPGPDIIAGKVLNAFLGAVGCSVLFVIGRVIWSRAIGIVAGLLLTFFPSHIFYSTMILTEVTYATLITLVVLLFVWVLTRRPDPDARFSLPLGLLLGAAALVRGDGVLLPLVFAAVWWLSTGSLRRAAWFGALSFLGLALVLAGWTVRNSFQLGAPVPISTGSSVVLAVSHWEWANGDWQPARARYLHAYYEELPYPEREAKASQKQLREALDYFFTHPGHELSLIPRRLYQLYRHDHYAIDLIERYEVSASEQTLDKLRVVSDVYYFAALGFALVGVYFWWRARREFAVLLVGIIVYMSAIFGILFFGSPRYHTPLIPIICLLAAPGLVAVRDVGTAAMRGHWFTPPTAGRP